ncbi:MAG: ribokinase [Pleomorphochaeta sp.]
MKILNYGSLNIDYVYKVDHFVMAGETQSSLQRTIFPGGKGLNQSVALANAGADTYHAGAIGKEDGAFLKNLLSDSNVNVDFVREFDSPTGHTIIQVNKKGNNCILLYPGANHKQEEAYIESVFESFDKGDYVVLQNEINNIKFIMDLAHKKEMIICFNPSPFNEKISELNLNYVDYFLLNEIEAAMMCNCDLDTPKDQLIEILKKNYPSSKFVLTLGKAGVVYFDDKNSFEHGIYDVPVVDTTAAGDTFTGFFIASISNGVAIDEALRLASIASSIAVSKNGAAVSIPKIDEVKNSKLKLM